ncbi:MAG TPA: Gfo/Idh/MocA family oxidoreductase [Opitutaceae bacterium]|nr:Gfo/Idh/MocA family oxidoreductase [Opitutaceae bacterium]
MASDPHRDPSFSASSRRSFVRTLAAAGLGALAAPSLANWARAAEDASAKSPQRKIGIALLGLGGYAGGQLAPALQQTKLCRLAAVVTGTPSKGEKWQRRYDLPASAVYSYETFDRIADNKDVDVVYVVTPNALHRDFVIRAAKAGKHVICEKPMATTVEDCDAMIAACKDAKRQLAIGYRLHFEPYNIEAARLGTSKAMGPVKTIKSEHSFVGSGGTWRFNKRLAGGGPLMDVGIYSLQAACYVTGEEPVGITAKEWPKTDPERFAEVEETISWTMEFPSGARAECRTSYNEEANYLHVDAADGWFELSPAFSYRGVGGKTSRGAMNFPRVTQQALQMDGFARTLLHGEPNIVPGEMGRRDVRLLLSIYEAARTGKRVAV